VREVCHEQVYDESESIEERIFWNSWQAPSFLVMKPWLHRPYDPDRAWDLQDPETSRKWLEAIADHYVLLLGIALKDAAGKAALQLAKQPKDAHSTAADNGPRRERESMLPRPVAKRNQPSKRESHRRVQVVEVIKAELKGLGYCKALDGRGVRVPLRWREEGCPSTYFAAYKSGEKWRKRIQDEKSRLSTNRDRASN
jgi:hypothetical protein